MKDSKSNLDKFTYGTFEVQKSEKEIIHRTGHRLGPLAAVQARPTGYDNEIWAIVCLASGSYMFPVPIFTNIDDAAGYILDINPLADWATADVRTVKRYATELVGFCLANNGFPLSLTPEALEEAQKDTGRVIAPGTQGFNGYHGKAN